MALEPELAKKVLQVCLNMVITGKYRSAHAMLTPCFVHRESRCREDHSGSAGSALSACLWCAAEGHFRGEEWSGAEGAVCGPVLPSSSGRGG